MRILVVDNYDSFVYNLVHYLAQLGADTVVRRNDEMAPDDLAGFDGVLTSPGPSTPESAGISVPIVAECAQRELRHGKTSDVHHKGVGVLAGLPDPFTATRYHSLAVLEETLPPELEVTGR